MIKYLVHLLFFITLCVVLSTCKHEPPPEPPKVCQYDSSIEEMKKWYYFKTGTQWIYQEQTTGELDTVTVYENADGSNWFEFSEFHSYGGWLVHYWHDPSWSIPCLTTKECTCHKVFRSRGKPGNFVGEARPFIYPGILGDYIGDHSGLNTAVEIQDSTIQLGQTYYETILWDIPDDASEGYIHTSYRVAKNVGIIYRSNYSNNTGWELIEYSIIQ